MNISSVLVDVQASFGAAVRQSLAQWPGVEVHAATPEGRLVVTVETDTDAEATDTFTRIGALEGVMSVSLVYHQFEPEPEQEALDGTDAT